MYIFKIEAFFRYFFQLILFFIVLSSLILYHKSYVIITLNIYIELIMRI